MPKVTVTWRSQPAWNVYYRNRNTGRLCRYCVSAMTWKEAAKQRDRFNEQYPDKRYPNGKGYYPFTEAFVAVH